MEHRNPFSAIREYDNDGLVILTVFSARCDWITMGLTSRAYFMFEKIS